VAETPFDQFLGRVVRLRVQRFAGPGAFLSPADSDGRPGAPTILLPGGELPAVTREGDELEVFVYLDSEDRPVATLRPPRVKLEEVAFLAVTDVTRFGAFVDWGMPKELLVPHAEQTRTMRVGERCAIGVLLDDTRRLAGTMRVSEMLRTRGDFGLDAWVEGEAWRNEPELGLFVIVQRKYLGLLPASEPHSLTRGESARLRVTRVLPDKKIELSLRALAHEEVHRDARKILEVLSRPGMPKLGDRSSPEEIRAAFGLSKKAFKRAVGRLFREKDVDIDPEGFVAKRPREGR
jgi:predicted RNA-binding protein (virulence factor B family)